MCVPHHRCTVCVASCLVWSGVDSTPADVIGADCAINRPVDVGTALMNTQRWMRTASVPDIGDLCRDMALPHVARDVETVLGSRVCVCGGMCLYCPHQLDHNMCLAYFVGMSRRVCGVEW